MILRLRVVPHFRQSTFFWAVQDLFVGTFPCLAQDSFGVKGFCVTPTRAEWLGNVVSVTNPRCPAISSLNVVPQIRQSACVNRDLVFLERGL